MSDYPQDIIDAAKNALVPIMSPDLASEYEIRLVAHAIMAERERCALIIEHRPLAIPDRQELAAYIRSGWHSLYAEPRQPTREAIMQELADEAQKLGLGY